MFGICNLSNVPLRCEPNDRSEMVSQVLFGEHFKVLDIQNQWVKIHLAFDDYEGWIDLKQFQIITELEYKTLTKKKLILNADLVEYISSNNGFLTPITLGASLSFLDEPSINTDQYEFTGNKIFGKKAKKNIIKTAYMYLNAPYLWGGKTPFGIDCSGFTQMVYKLNGHKLKRDASQQAKQGEALSFIEESQAGDLAFFDNDEGNIIHVGIIMEGNYIIHASGKVRIDRLDHLGIFNAQQNRHTHKLRVIKKII
ncbi:hydrolase Nlp/P60 [Flavobacterium branchiophilum]|uniref:Hydrolase Nlp/P60 n=2 Tax=Flavobacterium branchiophilum TaxID=55197 RepID=A0A2H3KDL0_9FLAO|nr:C40 family peptidase [Flavobacterium branchiophilum]OXA70910.1 hydrolase Nlp/P60 [Flavobacterium branchiophilum] [Flavobacterium branchiophilum NBRC 15030 = ATCC 35035]PDS25866.1 hydrolase Nlp/P60 [Flavobacterium branchiophilum]TQM41789.1 SH3 domain-containing protein [Flavobacterium branchiophilum]CCB69372.1 Probable cell wall-associated hydrolase [Flavobacterium branchiophilum FL-15]GEM56420.1 hydrolase Nlp/P60 [Flavobacterium branchiophilum NBRC 15030 = ATCC 35035]